MLEAVLAGLLDLVRQYGLAVLFLVAFLENALLVGWLVPGEALLAVARTCEQMRPLPT